MHRRSVSVGGEGSAIKRAQNAAARAAAARLAQVMAASPGAGDDEERWGNLTASGGSRYGALPLPSRSNGHGGRFEEHTSSTHAVPIGMPTISAHSMPMVSPSPASRTFTVPGKDASNCRHREKRFSADFRHLNLRDTGNNRETSELQDEIDMLQEENDNILEKLKLAEDRCEEAEARARELENQVAALGEGVSLEARLLSRKEATLRQREVIVRHEFVWTMKISKWS